MPPAKRLQAARQQLRATDVPFQIRAVSYLRLSCFALDSEGSMYATYMSVLFNHDPQWWQKCRVTSLGILKSSDFAVDHLLRPITDLHNKKMQPSVFEPRPDRQVA